MYHPLVEKIKKYLTENNAWFETFEHEAVRTSEEASKIRPGYNIKQGSKSLIIRVKDRGNKYFVMIVVPGDTRFNTSKVRRLVGSNDVRFASEAEVAEVTEGVLPGGVPPFGNLFDIRVIADPQVFENEKIVFNAGDRSYSIAMKSADYVRLVNPEIKEVT